MYRYSESAICFVLLRHVAVRAFSRAWANTGNRIAARMAMMAITTSNSIKVKPALFRIGDSFPDHYTTPPVSCRFVLGWASLPQRGGRGSVRDVCHRALAS